MCFDEKHLMVLYFLKKVEWLVTLF